jgi:GT2 family glycosyltransferase
MNARNPWLSVVMPTYNGAAYLEAALDSVRREDLDGVEVVAVDDGSTDATADILRRYAGSMPLRIVGRRGAGNWVATSNAGLLEASGKYACFLHQDDLWLPGRLAALRAEVERGLESALLVHSAIFVGPHGEPLGRWSCPLPSRHPLVPAALFLERLLVQNFIAIPSPMFDRGEALRSGALDESLWYTADWDLWLRLGRLGPVRYLPASLAAFRVHPGSQTVARPSNADDRRRQLRTVLDRHLAALAESGGDVGRLTPVAEFSVELNVALAGAARGDEVRWAPLLARFLRLGASGWTRYWHDSRILERVRARRGLRRRR